LIDRFDSRPRRSLTHIAGCAPGPNSDRTSSTHCSSTGTTQSISGTVNTVRRFGGLPRDALPNRTLTQPNRPNRAAFGLRPTSEKSSPHASPRRNPYA